MVVLFHIINSERVSSQQRQIKRQCNVSMLYNYLPSWLFHCFTFSSEEPLQHKQRGNKSIPGKETQLQYESHTARENQGYEEHVKAYFITFYLVPIKEAIMPFNQPLLFSVKQHWCIDIEYVKQADGLGKKVLLALFSITSNFQFWPSFSKRGTSLCTNSYWIPAIQGSPVKENVFCMQFGWLVTGNPLAIKACQPAVRLAHDCNFRLFTFSVSLMSRSQVKQHLKAALFVAKMVHPRSFKSV